MTVSEAINNQRNTFKVGDVFTTLADKDEKEDYALAVIVGAGSGGKFHLYNPRTHTLWNSGTAYSADNLDAIQPHELFGISNWYPLKSDRMICEYSKLPKLGPGTFLKDRDGQEYIISYRHDVGWVVVDVKTGKLLAASVLHRDQTTLDSDLVNYLAIGCLEVVK